VDKDLDGDVRGLLEGIIPAWAWRVWGKAKLFSIADNLLEIRSGCLRNTCLRTRSVL